MNNSAETGTVEAHKTENNAEEKKAFNFTGIPLLNKSDQQAFDNRYFDFYFSLPHLDVD